MCCSFTVTPLGYAGRASSTSPRRETDMTTTRRQQASKATKADRRLSGEVRRHAAVWARSQYQLVVVAAEFADSGEWALDGSPTAAHWLAAVADVETCTTREWIRIGRCLEECCPRPRTRSPPGNSPTPRSGPSPASPPPPTNTNSSRSPDQPQPTASPEPWRHGRTTRAPRRVGNTSAREPGRLVGGPNQTG